MQVKDILAIVATGDASEHVLDMAEQLAEQDGGHVTTLAVNWLPSPPVGGEVWIADPWWGDVIKDTRARLDAHAVGLRARAERRTGQADVETALLHVGATRYWLGMRARHADIAIVSRPAPRGDLRNDNLEGPLFDSGRPVLLAPPGWRRRPIGKSVLICWKPTREAARAVADADRFLATASKVSVVTVDATPSEEGYGPQPGGDICAHLARRGQKVELFNLDSSGRSDAQTILDHAAAVDADLIVMGGFGRSRMSEFIFGGMTRDMLKMSPVPLLMSH